MIDLDEYLMSLRADLPTISHMVNACPERSHRQRQRGLAESDRAIAVPVVQGPALQTNLWVTRFQAYHSDHVQVSAEGMPVATTE